jgi:hypothetical protein
MCRALRRLHRSVTDYFRSTLEIIAHDPAVHEICEV